MKKMFFPLALTLCIILYNIGQISGNVNDMKFDFPGSMTFAAKDTLKPESQRDTTEIKFKDKKIRITEDEEGTNMEVKGEDEEEWDFDEEDWEHDWDDDDPDFDFDFGEDDDFDVHWSGIEFGLNNYVNNDFSLSLSDADSYMDLNTGKSWNINVNVIEYDLNLIGNHFGIGTGLGIELNDYRFDNQLPVKKGDNRIVVDSSYVEAGYNLEKAKLTTTYLTVPVILEYQVPVNDNKFFIAVGMIGGMKLGSHSKVVYRNDGDKNKDKNRSDFYLSPFRYGYTARVGYGFLKLFANYYDTRLFEEDKGPELHPFTIGFMISF